MTTDNKDRKPDVGYTTEYEGAKVEYKIYITPSKVDKDKPKDKKET